MKTESLSKLAAGAALATGFWSLVFGIAIFVPALTWLTFASSIGIALCFLTLAIANGHFAAEGAGVFSDLSRSFAIIYCVLVCIVYYVQLSFVRLGSPSPEALSVVAYAPPRTAFFALDILGYSFMSLSIVFISRTINGSGFLKASLAIFGALGTGCAVIPLLPFLYAASDSSSDIFGMIALASWSILFVPLTVLLARHYHRNSAAVKNA